MARVVHFEIPADDTGRCENFYQAVFGWKFHRWEGPMDYWMVSTGTEARGIDGGMMKRMAPGTTTVNTIEVQSIDETLERIRRSGGQVTVPKGPIPGVGWIAYCSDTESNVFGVLQPDENAK